MPLVVSVPPVRGLTTSPRRTTRVITCEHQVGNGFLANFGFLEMISESRGQFITLARIKTLQSFTDR